jgi:methylase of polypeptide subunit release factors
LWAAADLWDSPLEESGFEPSVPPLALAFEPFCGSGTQIVAAEKEGRRCYAVDLAPAYCDVAVKRWSKFTGRTAVLADDGRMFDDLAAVRHDS